MDKGNGAGVGSLIREKWHQNIEGNERVCKDRRFCLTARLHSLCRRDGGFSILKGTLCS